MDRLISAPSASDPNVQQPLPIRSVLFLQDSVKYALQHLATSLIGNSFDLTKVYILYGCVKTVGGGNDSFTQGAVYYFGEIFYVSAASFATGTDYAYLLISNGSQDPIKMKYGTSDNVHNLRRVIISGTAASGGSQTAIPNFTVWVTILEAWINMPLVSPWIVTGVAKYRKNNQGLVSLKGLVRAPNTASNIIFNLPAGYRPAQNIQFVVSLSGTNGVFYNVSIATNGDVTLNDISDYVTNHPSIDISMNGINFYID